MKLKILSLSLLIFSICWAQENEQKPSPDRYQIFKHKIAELDTTELIVRKNTSLKFKTDKINQDLSKSGYVPGKKRSYSIKDSVIVNRLLSLADINKEDSTKCLQLINEAATVTESINDYEYGRVKVWLARCEYSINAGNGNAVKTSVNECIYKFQRLEKSEDESYAWFLLAKILQRNALDGKIKSYEEAIKTTEDAILACKKNNSKILEIRCYLNFVPVMKSIGDFNAALDNIYKAKWLLWLERDQINSNTYRSIESSITFNTANLYLTVINKFDTRLNDSIYIQIRKWYAEAGIGFFENNEFSFMLQAMNNLGIICSKDSASTDELFWRTKLLDYNKCIGTTRDLQSWISNIIISCLRFDSIEKAHFFLDSAKKIIRSPSSEAYLTGVNAWYQLKLKNFHAAEEDYIKAYNYGKSTLDMNLWYKTARELSKLYDTIGNYKEEAHFLNIVIENSDSISVNASLRSLNLQKLSFDKLFKKQVEEGESNNKMNLIKWLIGGLIVILATLLICWIRSWKALFENYISRKIIEASAKQRVKPRGLNIFRIFKKEYHIAIINSFVMLPFIFILVFLLSLVEFVFHHNFIEMEKPLFSNIGYLLVISLICHSFFTLFHIFIYHRSFMKRKRNKEYVG